MSLTTNRWVIIWLFLLTGRALAVIHEDETLDLVIYDQEEPLVYKEVSAKYDFFQTYTHHKGELVNILAGRAEFPWLVDVRMLDYDETTWSIGNLIDYDHVLVTCRWIQFHAYHDPLVHTSLPKVPEVSVSFCTSYLWESFDAPQHVGSNKTLYTSYPPAHTSGTRLAKFLSPHPLCELDPYQYDVGIIELSRGIPPVLPHISYMPMPMDRNAMRIRDFDLHDRPKKSEPACFVASYGRNYVNQKNHLAIDYKVRFRAYQVIWEDCIRWFKAFTFCGLVPGIRNRCEGGLSRVSMGRFNQSWPQLMCFETRASPGTVCDHDLGAPIVCNGYVFGIVVRGCVSRYCNANLQLPFIVLKITAAADYYATYAKSPYFFNPLSFQIDYMAQSQSPRPTCCLPYILFYLLLTVFSFIFC